MKTYLIRLVTPLDLDKMDMLLIEARFSPLHARQVEIFNADDFMKKCDDESSFNEIDIERLFVDILHFDKEDVRRVLRPWEING